ncbi:hypothetical protein SAMN05443667_102352 [Flavobacterium gillisiae]|uniref:Lipoprotein n=1 Tax=Flavobacterium gillisiae TaxID=150146 RepID=A0A1H3ZCZ4_9FLAO|nr:hypothetical protein [Flavobacterium gillisiae]SEA21475.1 hypothetical protein SAMN05443667_102352 [Flavobacterium gillisiae]
MTRFILIIVLSLTLFSCNDQKAKQEELVLKAKELQLQEKELELREKDLPTEAPDTTQTSLNEQEVGVETQTASTDTNNKEKSKIRKLRFLYYSNVSLRAYFDDGSIIDCPRCKLTKENVLSLQNNTAEKAVQTYVIEKDGSLLVDGWKYEYPSVNKDEDYEGWAMINYKWHVKY